MPVSDGVRALEEDRAFVDLTGWRAVVVSGTDAVRWLNDLVTNRVDDIGEGLVRRSLFLDRTGRIRADVLATALPDGGGLCLVQDPVQARPIDELLGPYVLSSDVTLEDRTGDIGVVVVANGGDPGSLLRFDDAHGEPGDAERRGSLRRLAERDALVEASLPDLELARIRAGLPRFWVDAGEDALPAEAGWEWMIDQAKGCFLGQESVAKVRNLGHPPRPVVALDGEGEVLPMAPIVAGGEEVGRVTSVAPNDAGGTACIGRIRWEAREAELSTAQGVPLTVRSAG
ncbi:MAG TPA: hypothetical protein VGB19_14745 [Actinomycetota bacterium]